MAAVFLALLVAGCADSPAPHETTYDEHPVLGDSTHDRAAIDETNERILGVEHSASPNPDSITTAPPYPEMPPTPAPEASPDSAPPAASGTNS